MIQKCDFRYYIIPLLAGMELLVLNTLVTVINKKFLLTASPPLIHGRSPQAANVFEIVNE